MINFFEKYPEVLAVMSEREDGSMKLLRGKNLNLENRAIFFRKIRINESKIISAEIAQGAAVEIVDVSSLKIIYGADSLITQEKNVFLSITVADCVPVYIYEQEHGIISLIHCGWRGISDGIIENTLRKIMDLGGKAENLKIALGPGINICHFEIKEDILDKFSDYPEFIIRRDDKISIDLKGIIRKKLADFNVDLDNIEDNRECTAESDKYFSFRRDKPKIAEAMVAVLGIRK
jgi:hypothetical protein